MMYLAVSLQLKDYLSFQIKFEEQLAIFSFYCLHICSFLLCAHIVNISSIRSRLLDVRNFSKMIRNLALGTLFSKMTNRSQEHCRSKRVG